jgi:DNA-binding winged helix-turn-helix (wHTH) protein
MRVRFGDFELNTDARLLHSSGTPVHLSPKAFDLLCLLVAERPTALDKQTLISRIWPDAFVSDGSLAVLMTELRSALQDSATTPRFLRTVPRFGYAFCGHVEDAAASGTESRGSPATAWLLNRTHRIPLAAGVTTVGRDPGCEEMIDAPSVSRRHAHLIVSIHGIIVEDLGSKNGTFVNDTAVTAPTPVTDGDRVRFGSVQFLLRASDIETLTRA